MSMENNTEQTTSKNNSQNNSSTVIPNQTNINEIVKRVVEDASKAETIIEAVIGSIVKISKSKAVDVEIDSIKRVEIMVNDYNRILRSIINVLTEERNDKSLDQLLGAVKTADEKDNKKTITKYTVIDAALQIPKVIESMMEAFDTIAENKFSLKSFIRFKFNIMKLKPIINDLYRTIIDTFSSIDTTQPMDKIIKVLVKQPDIVLKTEQTNQTDEFNKVSEIMTETKSGQLGVLDVFTKTLEIVNSLNTLRLPNLMTFSFNMTKMEVALGIMMSKLMEFANTYASEENQKNITKIESVLLGERKKDETREGGISSIISGINNIFMTLNRMNLSVKSMIKFWLMLKTFKFVVNRILSVFGSISALTDGNNIKMLDTVKSLMIKIGDIFSIIAKIGLLAIPILIFSKVTLKALLFVRKTFRVLRMITSSSQEFDSQSLDGVADVLKTINKIMILSSLTIVLAIPAMLGLLAIIAFSWVLSRALIVMAKVSITIRKMTKHISDGFREFSYLLLIIAVTGLAIVLFGKIAPLVLSGFLNFASFIFITSLAMLLILGAAWVLNKVTKEAREEVTKFASSILIMTLVFALVGLTLLMFAAISPLILDAVTKNFGGFIVGLLVSMGIVLVLAKILVKLGQKAAVESVKFAIAIAILCGAFILAGLIVLEAAFVGKQLNSWDTWGHIALGIAGMTLITVAMIGLGIALSAGAVFIGWAAVGMGSLMTLLALFAGVGLAVLAISKMKFELGSYKKGTSATNNIGTGTGAVGNICIIRDFIKLLLDKLDLTRKEKKQAGIARKTVEQVKKTVGYMAEIANSLMEIQHIELDTALIISKVGNIFDFITELNVKIEGFLNPKEEENKTSLTPEPGFFSRMFGGTKAGATKRAYKKANKMLNKVQKVITTLADIGNAINSILELKLDVDTKNTITGNLGKIFEFIEELDSRIKELMRPEAVTEGGAVGFLKSIHRRAQKMKDDYNFNKADEKMSKIESVILSIQNIGEAFNTLKDLEFTETTKDVKGTKDKIIGNVNNIITTIKDIAKQISDESASLLVEDDYEYAINGLNSLIEFINKSNEAFKQIESIDNSNFDTKKLNDKIDIISRLNKEIRNFGGVKEKHAEQTKDMISSHIDFLNKINTVDVNKLKVSANMVESMAKLSKSIRGNFEGLAESINEDLMPVLEELKKIMETIPEKLEVGFQNTSASIGAAQAPQTTANVTAQVKRENPNLTVDQVNNIVDQRLKERASEQAGNKTISDIYNLLAGMSSNKAKVKLL